MYVVQSDVFKDSQDIFLIDSITNFIGHLLHPWHHVNFRKQNNEHCSCPWGTHTWKQSTQTDGYCTKWQVGTYKVLREQLKGRNLLNPEGWGRLHTRAKTLNKTSFMKILPFQDSQVKSTFEREKHVCDLHIEGLVSSWV